MNTSRLARCGVAIIAFAVTTHLVFKVVTLLVHAALASMYGAPDTWPDALDKVVSLASLLLALRVAFAVGRRLWPEHSHQDLTRAREAAEAAEAKRKLAQ